MIDISRRCVFVWVLPASYSSCCVSPCALVNGCVPAPIYNIFIRNLYVRKPNSIQTKTYIIVALFLFSSSLKCVCKWVCVYGDWEKGRSRRSFQFPESHVGYWWNTLQHIKKWLFAFLPPHFFFFLSFCSRGWEQKREEREEFNGAVVRSNYAPVKPVPYDMASLLCDGICAVYEGDINDVTGGF